MLSSHRDRRMPRALVIGAAAAILSSGGAARAVQAETVPLELQAELIKKVVRYERGFLTRSGAQIDVLLVVRAGDSGSERAAAQLAPVLRAMHDIAGKPVVVFLHHYTTAAELREAIVSQGAELVYYTPGLESEVAAIAAKLEGVPAITVASESGEVDRGAVLGFELVSARLRISINLGQARRQRLDFNSEILRLSRVIR